MTVYGVILIAFLVSLFIGSKSLCIGLGITVAVLTIICILDSLD